MHLRSLSDTSSSTPRSPAARLAECEDDLTLIASDVGELVEELTRLRSHGHDLVRDLEERRASVEQYAEELARLEAERAREQERADRSAEALGLAEARLSELNEHVETLARESSAARAQAEEREHRLVVLEARLSQAKVVFLERERTLEQERSSAQKAVEVAEQWRRHAKELERRLADASEALRRLESRDRESREHVPAPAELPQPPGHLRLIAGPDGYRLTASRDECPRVGDRVVVSGMELRAIRIGRSPLYGDDRPCVFLHSD